MQRVSQQQATVNAIGRWLAARMPGIVINDKWPQPDVDIPNRTITILLAGAPKDELFEPTLISKISNTPPTYRWEIRCRRQSIQLDLWATNGPDLDDMVAQLDELLGMGDIETLDPAIALPLADGWTGTVQLLSDEGASFDPTPARMQRKEFRATRMGTVDAMLTVDAATGAIARIRLRQMANIPMEPGELADVSTLHRNGRHSFTREP